MIVGLFFQDSNDEIAVENIVFHQKKQNIASEYIARIHISCLPELSGIQK